MTKQTVASARIALSSAARQEPVPEVSTVRGRSKGIALLLALFLGGIGAHLFYLGYYGRGTAYLAATAAALLLFSVAVILAIASISGGGAGLMGLLIAGTVLSSVVNVLSLVDIIRIIIGDLKPKNGEYYPGFFQTHAKSK